MMSDDRGTASGQGIRSIPRFHLSLLICGALMVISGVALLARAASEGDAELSLVLVFPVISASGLPGAVGALLLVVGIFVVFVVGSLSWFMEQGYEVVTPAREQRGTRRVRASGGAAIFIGPVPIIISSNRRVNYFSAALLLTVVAVLLVLYVM